MHEGQHLEPAARDIEALLASSQARVTGEVHLLFRPGVLFVEGVTSAHSLLAATRGKYGESAGEWSAADALGLARKVCVYVGDSPNDAPMFRAFELSIGVASVADYGDLLEHVPRYVTESDGGAGFAEVVAHLTCGVTT